MSHIKPPSAPSCWGAKYQDGERECMQCRFNDSCQPAMVARLTPMSLPVIRNYTPPPPPHMQPTQAIVPLPKQPYYAPPVSQLPVHRSPSAPQTTTQTVQQATHYYQQATGYSLPNHQNPNPMAPMHRPGAPAPSYYFTQYPGESVGSRVVKNTVLRAMEAVFYELMQFFRHWTWPPR